VADDPEHERRKSAFWRLVVDREPAVSRRTDERLAIFLAGCEYEAGVLEDLLEHMGREAHGELELLRQVAEVLEGWTGSMEDHAQASLVFDKVQNYVRMRDNLARREDQEDED